MLLARFTCFSSFSSASFSHTLSLLSILFVAEVAVKRKGGGGGYVRCYKRHKLFCSHVVSCNLMIIILSHTILSYPIISYHVAIRLNIAKDTEYILKEKKY